MKLKDFAKSGHPMTLFMSFLYFDVSFMIWVLIGVLGVHIAGDFGLSPLQKGVLVALPLLGGSLVRIPMGILVDRIGPKRTGILGQLIVLLPLVLAWQWADTFPQILALGLLLGVAGGSFTVALPLAGRWYPPEHQGLAMGIAGAGNSGTVLAALFAPRLAAFLGWQAVFGAALIPAVLTLILFSFFARESPSRSAPRPWKAYFEVWRRRDTLWFCLLYGFTFGGFVGFASFLVIFFHDQYGVAKVTAGTLTALCVFCGSFMRPLGGYLADRFGGLRMLAVLFMTASLGLASAALLPPFRMATAILSLIMGCMGMGNGALFQMVPQRFPKEVGTATGVIGAAGGLGGFFLPIGLGYLKGVTGSYGAGFFFLSLAGAYGAVLLSFLRRPARLSPPPVEVEVSGRVEKASVQA